MKKFQFVSGIVLGIAAIFGSGAVASHYWLNEPRIPSTLSK